MARVAARALLLVGSLDAFSDEFRMPDRPWWRGFDAEPRAAELPLFDPNLIGEADHAFPFPDSERPTDYRLDRPASRRLRDAALERGALAHLVSYTVAGESGWVQPRSGKDGAVCGTGCGVQRGGQGCRARSKRSTLSLPRAVSCARCASCTALPGVAQKQGFLIWRPESAADPLRLSAQRRG